MPLVQHRNQITAPLAVPADFRVLVAEDDPVQGLLMMTFLDRLGVRAALVIDGAQAVKAVKHGSYALVLMDHLMPRMNGAEATVAIREWERATDRQPMPIIAVTASAMQDECEVYLRAGMNGVLLKPFSVRDLARTVVQYAAEVRA